MPTACMGLLAERGKNGPLTSPAAATTVPAWSRTTTEPWWYPSTKPDRTTSASRSPPAYVSATGLHPQQVARLRRGRGRPLGHVGEPDRPGDELHVGLDRLALGVRQRVLHADPQMPARGQAREHDRDRGTPDAGGRERRPVRQVTQAGDERLGGTGHPTGYPHHEVDVHTAAGRRPVPVEQSLKGGELTEVEDLVLGDDPALLHPGVQLDDELPPVEEDPVAEVDRTHRAGGHVRFGVEYPQPVGLGVGDRATGGQLDDEIGALAQCGDGVPEPAEVEGRL